MVHMGFFGETAGKRRCRKRIEPQALKNRGGGICPVVKVDFTPREVVVLQARSGT
jgi:hypothetical protein